MGWIIFILATIGWHIGVYGMFKKQALNPGKLLYRFTIPGAWLKKQDLKKPGSGCSSYP
jgi:signal peptidase I